MTMPQKNAPKKNDTALLIADLIVVAAILVLFFSSQVTENTTLAAIISVTLAGFFVTIPLGFSGIRGAKNDTGAIQEAAQVHNEFAKNQRLIQDDLHNAADTILKRLAILEKHISTPANPPALGEIAGQIAALASINAEDGDLPRLRNSLEEMQSQLSETLENTTEKLHSELEKINTRLDAMDTAFRQFESALTSLKNDTAAAPVPDGPLPPSLMAKAFSTPQTNDTAVSRLIKNGTDEEFPRKPILNTTHSSEDEIWHSATDKANEEHLEKNGPINRTALHPKTSPKPTDKRQLDLFATNKNDTDELAEFP